MRLPWIGLASAVALTASSLLSLARADAVSSWLSVAIWKENASLCRKAGPPFGRTQAVPATENSINCTWPTGRPAHSPNKDRAPSA